MPADSPLDAVYEALYREHAPRVRALARRRLQGRGTSDDVVQEVFLRFYRALPELDLERPVWPWLRTVCVNVCTDVLRSPRTWAEEPVGQFADTAAAAEVDPVSLVVADEQRRAISDALDALAPRQREMLLRRVVEGATGEDMAEMDGTTVEAVKSAVKRGREAFRRAYLDIARERGLLGTPGSSLPERLRELAARSRSALDACVRYCNNAAVQSVPVGVAAIVLAVGWGAGPGGPARAGADADPRFATGEAALGHAVVQLASTRSSSQATRPGGGAPPSPPPGQNRPQGPPPRRAPLLGAETDSGVGDPDEGMVWIRLVVHNPGDSEDDAGEISHRLTADCNRTPTRAMACATAREHWPEDQEIAYWG